MAVIAVAALAVSGCSEAEPEATISTVDTEADIDCTTDLLACARASTLGDLVPTETTKATGEPIKLGMINQENTPAGSFPELSAAANAGIAFINEQLGGVDGRPIELEVCNTKFSPEGSTTCAQQFSEAAMPVVLGGIDIFGNGVDTLEANNIPFVGGIPVSAQSVENANSFQFSGGTWGAAIAFAEYASTELKAERIAILYGEFGPIVQGAEYAETVAARHGVETQMVPYPIVATDLSSQANAAVSADPDAIIVLAADTACKPAMDALHASGTDAAIFYVGACAAPAIIDSVDPDASEGAYFNVEGPIDQSDPTPDTTFYSAVVNEYGDGLNPIGAGTVSFRSLMNLYVVLRELGADGITAEAITTTFEAKVDAPSFMGHDYTCDQQQLEGLPAMCSPQQILGQVKDGELGQVSDWIDVGAIYAG
ncbi:MAG: ABC transporter substrate-binding protein [Aquihabitans sp.]